MAFEVKILIASLTCPPKTGNGQGQTGITERISCRQIYFFGSLTLRGTCSIEIGRAPCRQRKAAYPKA